MKTSTDQNSNQFRFFLQRELMKRCEKNPNYSLRSFAKSIGVQPATLSHILRGSRKITARTIKNISYSLHIKPEDIQKFIDSEAIPQTDVQQLAIDHFHYISEWYHLALVELLTLKNFKNDPKWMAKTLGISTSEVNIALERLVRLEILKQNKDGKYIPTHSVRSTTHFEGTNSALKKLQKQYLAKSIESIDVIDNDERDHTGVCFSVNKTDIPELKNKIKNFRRELMKFAERRTDRDEVYQLSVSLFPLSNTEKE